jgi:hypothetical protein
MPTEVKLSLYVSGGNRWISWAGLMACTGIAIQPGTRPRFQAAKPAGPSNVEFSWREG